MLGRRSFFKRLFGGAAAAGAAIAVPDVAKALLIPEEDADKLLWTPKTIVSVPDPVLEEVRKALDDSDYVDIWDVWRPEGRTLLDEDLRPIADWTYRPGTTEYNVQRNLQQTSKRTYLNRPGPYGLVWGSDMSTYSIGGQTFDTWRVDVTSAPTTTTMT